MLHAPNVASPLELPLTPRQRLIWIEETLNHGLPLNTVTTLLEIRGEVDMSGFGLAFDRLVERHEALRMILPDKNTSSFLRLPHDKPSRLELVDLGGFGDGPGSFDGWLAERLRKPWSPNGSLFDVALVRRGANDHVFFVNRHHLISDNASSIVLHDELEALYLQCVRDKACDPDPSPLAPAPSYAGYLCAEAGAARGGAETSAAFWSRRQASKPPTLRFYGGPGSVSSILSRRISITLDADSSRHIDNAGGPAVASLLLLSALLAFLHRVTGETDLSIGVPLHNRTSATKRMVGLIMEVCPYRVRLEPTDTFKDVLQKVRQEIAEVRPHRRHTVSSSQAGYEVLFNFLPDVPTSFAGHESRYVHTSPLLLLDNLDSKGLSDTTLRSREKLAVTAQRGRGTPCYEIHFDFNRSILPPGMPHERAADHFVALLRTMLKDAGQSIASVDMLTPDERRRLLGRAPVSAAAAVKRQTVVDTFRAQAAAKPEREAVVWAGTRLTYGELDRHVQALALALRQAGVRPGSVVGVCVDRTPRMVVTLLAVLRAGGAYVPIDPGYPADRIELIMDDIDPLVLITESFLRERLGERWQNRVICFDDFEPEARPAELDGGPAPEHLAYIVHTSGSTGRPKGVPITHAQLAGFLDAMGDRIGMTPRDRVLASTSIAFDPMIVEVFLPLVTGACVVVAPSPVTVDGRALGRAVDSNAITVMQGTPATFRMLLSTGWTGKPDLAVLCGGEVMSTSLAQSLLARVGVLWNLYGPTETTVWATAKRVTSQADHVVPIGSPLDGSWVYILNHARVPVPIGVPGEICIGGSRVANGYHNRPLLTPERFLADPFSPEHSDSMYRTGDLGRALEDLELEFIGRTDNQVKVRGVRVELEEVEAAIAGYDGVSACSVTTFVDGSGETALRAHVEFGTGSRGPQPQDLLRFLRRRLPKHMLPARVSVVESLPRSPTGKVDRRAVAAMVDSVQPAIAAPGIQPANSLEADMLAIWKEFLQTPHLGVTDDFFEAGGHSLLAMTVMLETETRLGIELSLEKMFETPTVRAICESLDKTVAPRPAIAVALTKSRSGSTLYFLHGRSHFVPIAEALKDSVASAYVLTNGETWLSRLVGDGDPVAAITRISDAYAAAVLAMHREGDIYLAAHSFGGILAVETACSLEMRGAAPRRVFLFDTRLREDSSPSEAPAPPPRIRADVVNNGRESALGLALRRAGTRAYRGPSRPLSSAVVLFRAAGLDTDRSQDMDLTLGWGRHVDDKLTIIPIPGDHVSLIGAGNANQIAQCMRAHF